MHAPFAHLHVHSPWSFLDGASTLADLVQTAANRHIPALALTDHNSVSAAVRFGRLAQAAGIKPIIGSEITCAGIAGKGGPYHLVLLATGPGGYANLCRLLTRAHLEHKQGNPLVSVANLAEHADGLIALSGCRRGELASLLLRNNRNAAQVAGQHYAALFGRDSFFVELQCQRLPRTGSLNNALAELAASLHVGVVATNNVHYAHPELFPLHDLFTCIRTGTTLPDVHAERPLNAEAWLKGPAEMAALFVDYPGAVSATAEIAERCQFALRPGPRFPRFPVQTGESAAMCLRNAAYAGAQRCYQPFTETVQTRLDHELNVIARLGVADYFLVVADIVKWCRSQGIRYCGRGSAANSVVAHALGICDVDPISRNLLFERFLSVERTGMPDIDIDIASDRRDEVIEYVSRRYGREHVGMVCTFSTYQARSAVRDFGKAVGLPPAEIDRLAKSFPHMHADHLQAAVEAFPELRNGDFDFSKYRQLFTFASQAAGFPRHMSTHLGGVVISSHSIAQVSPLQHTSKGHQVLQFDKHDVEELGLLKLDLLSLRTLSAVDATLRSVQADGSQVDYAHIPDKDSATYAMLNRADTVGVFQLESPAQRALQSVLQCREVGDVVASIALIRPGPMRGNMVSPFIRRHQGLEDATYADPRLQPILEPTHGVVLYQEQVLQIAMTIAGFSAGEADQLRRAMSDCRSDSDMRRLVEAFTERAVAQGCETQVARDIGAYLLTYAGYGFCQGHAEAFAATAYKTAYLVRHYPAYYLAALMSNQPMGFYPAHTLCVAARMRGIHVLGPDVNSSTESFTVTNGGKAIRTSLRQVRHVQKLAAKIVAQRDAGGRYRDLIDFCRRVQPSRDALEQLILSGGCDSLDSNRRRLLWSMDPCLAAAKSAPGGLFPDLPPIAATTPVADFTLPERVRHEQAALGFTISAHPMQLLRPGLDRRGFLATSRLASLSTGTAVRVAGLVVRPQRPSTRSGKPVVFFTLEDECGLIDITVFGDVYQRDGRAIFTQPALAVAGRLARRGCGISITAESLSALTLAAEV